MFRLRIELTGQRQLSQVEVGTEEAEQLSATVQDALHGGQRRPPRIAADVGVGQRERVAGQRVAQVWPLAAIAPEVVLQQPCGAHIGRELAGMAVEDEEVFAPGQVGESLCQASLQR